MDGARPAARPVGEVVVAVVVALAVGALVLAGWFPNVAVPDRGPEPRGSISALYDPPSRSVEVALNIGDGQIFATQAVDPLATEPDVVRGGPEEQAYRYQRGAYGWIGWVASAGRADAVPWALAVVTVLSVALLVGVVAEVIRRQGGSPYLALVLLATPGVVTDLLFVGPEALGVALVVVGVAFWGRRPGSWAAVASFAAAGLCRETLLLVPAVLALLAAVDRRPVVALRAGAAALPYVAWLLFLRVRVGAWPLGSSDGRLRPLPFSGLVSQAGRWGPDDVAALVLVALLAGLGIARARDRDLRALLVAHVLLAAALGPAVWAEAAHAGRVLLPLCALGLVAAARPARSPARVGEAGSAVRAGDAVSPVSAGIEEATPIGVAG